jgi:hypothetical protein
VDLGKPNFYVRVTAQRLSAGGGTSFSGVRPPEITTFDRVEYDQSEIRAVTALPTESTRLLPLQSVPFLIGEKLTVAHHDAPLALLTGTGIT